MTTIADTFAGATAQQLEQQAHKLKVAKAYQELFHGTPTREHQVLVWNDLQDFCGMRQGLMRETDRETAYAIGAFRVWQRLYAFCFPRPADASLQGGTHDRSTERPHRPAAGGGVAEPTVD